MICFRGFPPPATGVDGTRGWFSEPLPTSGVLSMALWVKKTVPKTEPGKDQDLWSPGGLSLTHTHIIVPSWDRLLKEFPADL